MKRRICILILAILAVALLAACGKSETPAPAAEETATPEETAPATPIPEAYAVIGTEIGRAHV